jgi:L-alanine-DL-glutamate epimerase-like enolase superfamily enzyme
VTSFDALIVRIETACGLIGYGEAQNSAGSAGTYAALAALVNDEIGPELRKRDPRDITAIHAYLYNGVRTDLATARGHVFPSLARRGLTVSAISAIDIALWDILGKSLETPVWRLLGGTKAAQLPAYGSGGWAPADRIGDQLADYVSKWGVRAVKMRVGAMDGSVRRSADRVIAAREGLGPEIELMCDAHGTLTPAEAKRFCYLIRDCDVTWFEEPVAADDKVGMAEVRRSTHVPIAAGESEYTRFDFRDLIELRAVDVLQPDLAVCGGITEGRRIDALAAAYNLELAPHMWAGAPAFAAGLHLAAASTVSRLVEYPMGANPMLHELIEERFPIIHGMVEIPERPGLGITVREDVVREHAVGA